MAIKKFNMNDFRPEEQWIEVSTGDSVRILREFNELTQTQLAEIAGVALDTLAAIERDQLALDAGHAALLASALKVTPAVLLAEGRASNTKSAA